MRAFNETRGCVVAARVDLAASAWARMRGLLLRRDMGPEEGLWIVPCAMVHTCFMRFAIDAVFLDQGLRVLRVARRLGPWRASPWVRGAWSVLELASGASEGRAEAGEQLEIA